jgi:hypothetical protein
MVMPFSVNLSLGSASCFDVPNVCCVRFLLPVLISVPDLNLVVLTKVKSNITLPFKNSKLPLPFLNKLLSYKILTTILSFFRLLNKNKLSCLPPHTFKDQKNLVLLLVFLNLVFEYTI